VTDAPYQIRILQKRRELEALAADWDALDQARQNPLLSHRWFAAAANALHADNSLHVIELRRDARLVAMAPLARVRRRGVDWLEFIGAATLHEPTALLTDTESSARALCKALVDARRPFVLQRIPMDSGVMGLLSACAKGRGTLLVARSAPCQRVTPDLGNLVHIQVEVFAGAHDVETFGISLHHAVFDAVMHHLDEVP
jgi:CelD/BcsL family acetyltransferase involved in cellulose biosynthesis